MDPGACAIKPISKVRDNAVLFPIAIACGFWAGLAANFLRTRALRLFLGAAGFGLGCGALTGLSEASCNLG